MLEQLARYAEEHDIEREPGFASLYDVYWYIICDSKGRFLDVFKAGDKKNPPGKVFIKCPELIQPELVSGEETRRQFLVDTLDVVVFYGKNLKDKKTIAKHSAFVSLLRKASKVMPKLGRAASLLEDNSVLEEIRQLLDKHEPKANPNDKVTFKIGDSFPLESDAWHDWWKEYRQGLKKETLQPMRCLISGKLVEPQASHPKIKGLAGRGSGTALISSNKAAFKSYNLEKSANAAVSEEAAYAYRAGLNELIRKHSSNLAGAKVVHWFKEKVEQKDNPLSFLTQESQEIQELNAQHAIKQLLKSIEEGKSPKYRKLRVNHYFAFTLSGADARVMVREWLDGPFKELVENVSQWFADLEIVNIYGDQPARYPGIERIITSLLPPRKRTTKYKDWVKPVGSARIGLWHAAVKGETIPIPYSVIPRLVHLCRNFFISGDLEDVLYGKDKKNKTEVLYLLQTRMGLIKAYHLRKPDNSGGDLKPYLNEEHPNPAYHCGRLMAVLARLQNAALGDVGAGVVQRYYAAASATPALVLGRLTRTSQFHLSSLGKDKPGLAHWYEGKISAIWGCIKDTIPATLSLEEQSLFALGYYQQLADLRTKKSDKQEEVNNG